MVPQNDGRAELVGSLRLGLGAGGVETLQVEPEAEHRALGPEPGEYPDVRVVGEPPEKVGERPEKLVAVERRVEHDAVGRQRREVVDCRIGVVPLAALSARLGRPERVCQLVLVEVEDDRASPQTGRA